MKTLTLSLVVLALAGSALGGINTLKPMGPLYLEIALDGTAEMVNMSADPFSFDGFAITSAGGNLAYLNYRGFTMRAYTEAGFPEAIGQTQANAAKWSNLSQKATQIAEAYLNDLDPTGTATLPGYGRLALDAIFPQEWNRGMLQSDFTFTYVNSQVQGSWEGWAPEPASMSLMGLGALALIRRRR